MSAFSGVLYVVATPIGHLGDLSRRAENTLKSVQIIAAEDTRRTRVLLDHISHRAPELISLHDHNEQIVSRQLIEKLRSGADVAMVCDAGTPLINDPGYTLITMAHEQRIRTVPIPGPCSITAALSVCPLPCHPFKFVGFPSSKKSARQIELRRWLASGDALVMLEAPHRILATLDEIATQTSRRVMVGREMSKQYETFLVGSASEVADDLGANPKGEIVLIVESAEVAVAADHVKVLSALLKEMSPARAAKLAAAICDTKKADMYALALQLSER